jgi:hypothetical protein
MDGVLEQESLSIPRHLQGFLMIVQVKFSRVIWNAKGLRNV